MKREINILKLAPYYYPEKISSSHLTDDLNAAFDSAGYHTIVYAPTPCRGIDAETRRRYSRMHHETFENGSIDLYRFMLYAEGKNPIGRAIRYIICNIIHYYKGSHERNIDLIFSGSTPPTQGMLCALVKKRLSKKQGKKVPFLYVLQDVFPDSLVNAKLTRKGSVIWKIGRSIENYSYRNADAIITISDAFKQNIVKKGVDKDKVIVIPNWIDTEAVYQIERNKNHLFDKYNLDRDLFYICYSGNIGHSQNLDLLVSAAKEIRKQVSDIRFVLIGDGAAKDELTKRVESEALDNIIMLPFQNYADIASVFSLGDVGLIISKPGIGASSVPSKTWSIMAAEKPILASFDKNSQLAEVIDSSEIGIVSEANDLDGFCKAIIYLYSNRDMCIKFGKNGKKYISEFANKEVNIKKYLNVIEALLKN